MENRPIFVLKLSLKEIALRKFAATLWNESDILLLVAKIPYKCENYGKRKKLKETVADKIQHKLLKMKLPKCLIKQTMQVIKPMGTAILSWQGFHEKYLNDSKYFIDSRKRYEEPITEKLCWTTLGMVDYQKTAEEIIRSEKLDIVDRYKLASLYCLEDYIPIIWQQLSQDIKDYFCNIDNASEYLLFRYMQFFWPYILTGEEYKWYEILNKSEYFRENPITFNQHAFEHAACSGNKVAAEYFFQKLTVEEREASLYDSANGVVQNRNVLPYKCADHFPVEKHSETICYLMSLMTFEQQVELFKDVSYCFVRFFIVWPWHELFKDIVKSIWTLIPLSRYNEFLGEMCYAFENSEYEYVQLFHEFFIDRPKDFEKHFLKWASRFKFFRGHYHFEIEKYSKKKWRKFFHLLKCH